MSSAATAVSLSKDSQAALVQFQYQAYMLMSQQYNMRDQFRAIDLAYIRENDLTRENWRGRVSNAWGDADRYQNVTVPVVMPQVETSVVYQTSVFLTGTPLLGCVASPQWIDEARQLETVIDENATRGGWVAQLMMMFRNGFKYNIAAAEISWGRETTADYVTDVTFAGGKQAKPKTVIWEGNKLRCLDMYNTIFDTRVHPTRMHSHGEFAGYSELMGRVALKQFIADLGDDKIIANLDAAFASPFGGWGTGGVLGGGIMGFYIPPINPNALINKNTYATMDWAQWAGLSGATNTTKFQYQNLYEVTTLYIRLLPEDFAIRVPGAATPQVWKIILINHQVIVYAQRETNAHGYLPIIFTQPNEDGLAYQTKSVADNVIPMQSVSTALMNAMVASDRRAVSDRVLYDPSRIAEAAINSANPSAKIPCRPAAYGKNLSESVYQFPYRDDQAPNRMMQINQLSGMADYVSGHNKAQQGQFVKGNKTRHEYEDVMGHASGRDQMCSLLLEAQFFTPFKTILKANVMQFQGEASYYSREQKKNIKIDPVALRNAFVNFKISDGLTPSDKLINADVASVALQQIGSSPQLAAGYNINQLFSYIIKTQGGDLDAFEKSPEQMSYEQAVQAWLRQGEQSLEMLKTVAPLSAKDVPVEKLLELVKSLSPPQPLPAQFGWNPNPAAPATNSKQAALPASV